MRRILQVINGEFYAGAERVQDLLAQRLPGLGYRVGIACLKPDRFPRFRRYSDAPLHLCPMRHRFDLAQAWALVRLIRSENYELVHTHGPRPALLGRIAALRSGRPLVHHVHSATIQDTGGGLRDQINARVERLALSGSPRLIAVSRTLARELVDLGFDATRVTTVHNGVPGPAALDSKNRAGSPAVIGAVALFRPRKGVEVLVEALAGLVPRFDLRLHLVGEFETPGYRRQIEHVVKQHGLGDRVRWRGFAEDVTGELEAMDLLVLPSLVREGLPMVLLEAMAAGVPIVASAVEGVAEVIRPERDGLLVEPGNAPALGRAVARLLESGETYGSLRRNAFRKQAEQFSDTAMARGVAGVYAGVLDDG